MSYVHKITKHGFHDFISSNNFDYDILYFMDFILFSSDKSRNDFPEGGYEINTDYNRKKFFSVVFKCIYS